jgi:hypothetical protein
MSPNRPRVIDAPDAGKSVYRGWKEIASALDVNDWRMAYRASRRRIDPLRVRYDAFDRPWIYHSWLEAWVVDNDRSARHYDLEREVAPDEKRRTG